MLLKCTIAATDASSTLLGLGWCFEILLPKDWFDANVLSHNLQSYCTAVFCTMWVLLCCFRYLFCVKVFPHVSQFIVTGASTTFTMSVPQIRLCVWSLSFRVKTLPHCSHSNLVSRWILLCLARAPLAKSKSQISHFLVSWTFVTCCLKMYAVLKVFSQLVHFDSFFLWYCLKCLWKRGKVPKSFPHSGHSMSFWIFSVQGFCPNWKKNPSNIIFNFVEAFDPCLMQNLLTTFYHFAVF